MREAGAKWIEDGEDNELEQATIDSLCRQHLRDLHIVPYLGIGEAVAAHCTAGARNFEDRLRADGRSPAMIKRVSGDPRLHPRRTRRSAGLVAQNVVRSLSHAQRKQHNGAERRHEGPSSRWASTSPRRTRSSRIVGAPEGPLAPVCF